MLSDPHAFLEGLAPSTMRFGLERMRTATLALGRPWRAYRVLHVAGTNGKGSTCAFAEAILRAAGLRVGLYTSPHLEAVNERIRVDGRDIDDAALGQAIDAVCDAYPPARARGDDSLTYFELLTAVALEHFRRERVDVAILEVGLGGRLDATNVVEPTACAIATVALDHTEYLGDTLAEVAGEKAGILKPGVPCAVSTGVPEALAAIRARADEAGAPLLLRGRDFALEGGRLRLGERTLEGIAPSLAGRHQEDNAALAAMAACLAHGVSDEDVRCGLASARWPGRLETIGGVLLDGAHNEEGARALAAALRAGAGPHHLVFGALRDKDVGAMLCALVPVSASLYGVAPPNPRALEPSAYGPLVRSLGARFECPPDLPQSLARARAAAAREGGQAVVCGSLYLVGQARALLRAAAGGGRGRPAESLGAERQGL